MRTKAPSPRLGGSWIWHLLYGLLSTGTGVIAVAWPGPTLIVLAVVFGCQLITTGLFRLVGRGWNVVTGSLSAIAGLMLLAWPHCPWPPCPCLLGSG